MVVIIVIVKAGVNVEIEFFIERLEVPDLIAVRGIGQVSIDDNAGKARRFFAKRAMLKACQRLA